MGDERRDDAEQRRADVYSSARIGAAAALTIVLVVLLVLDVAVPDRTLRRPVMGSVLIWMPEMYRYSHEAIRRPNPAPPTKPRL